MEKFNYPFPLAANSSRHSHYHRFLLGADEAVLAPFPRPSCVGALGPMLAGLAEDVNLPRWRKLYQASIPWVQGFGESHYELGNVAAHRPLPREYGRPHRKYGAYDFVQVADPSLSALALVAGDRRIVERFSALSGDFCARVEAGVCSRTPGPSGSRRTGRMLAGQFAEPNNRWLMPFLHVHSRVLNFTSFPETPRLLDCIDPASLSRAGQRAKGNWAATQAGLLSDLGYRAEVCGETHAYLRVEGVCPRLVAAIEAPRIAVLRILERAIVGERPPSAERLCSELPLSVIAAMSEQLESLLARSLSYYKPAKIEIPSEGPWRSAVREHLSHYCPGSLELLDRTALRAKADIFESAVFPSPRLDLAHCHAPSIEHIEAEAQAPCDPELGAAHPGRDGAEAGVSRRLVFEFTETLGQVNGRIVAFGPRDPLVALRGILSGIDQLVDAADRGQLQQSGRLLSAGLEGREWDGEALEARTGRAGPGHRVALASLEDLFEEASVSRLACEQEIGERSL
jgi:hypothetical protein